MSEMLDKFDLISYLREKKCLVEAALDASVKPSSSDAGRIIESMRYSLLAGGKRIRPILCIAACEMFGGTAESAMPIAVALEMIHTMSLIHDDLPAMDNDDLRRGKPTNHVLFGESIAILAGDALLAKAFEFIATECKNIPPDRTIRILHKLGVSVGANGLAGGQAKDLECERKLGVTLSELEWIHIHKTAALLKVSVASGAIAAGASDSEILACEQFAEKIGLAFQIADDILDVTATSAELGKTAGKDVSADKATYVKLLGLDKSKIEAERLICEAKDSISIFGDKATPLLHIADFIINRKS